MTKPRCKQVYSTRSKPYYVMLTSNYRLCMGDTPFEAYLELKASWHSDLDKTSK